MKTGLENYISHHRNDFDSDEPDDDLIWNGISEKLDHRKKTIIRLRATAAIVILVLSFGYTIFITFKPEINTSEQDLSFINNSIGLINEERMFTVAIQEKMTRINASKIGPNEIQTLLQDLNELDKQYAAYVVDLKEFGNQPRIIRGIIRCYELKIRILEKTLREIEKNEEYENNKNFL